MKLNDFAAYICRRKNITIPVVSRDAAAFNIAPGTFARVLAGDKLTAYTLTRIAQAIGEPLDALIDKFPQVMRHTPRDRDIAMTIKDVHAATLDVHAAVLDARQDIQELRALLVKGLP